MKNSIDVRAIRKDLDLTQVELAHEMGVDQSTVSNWEQGHTSLRGPALRILLQLVAAKKAKTKSRVSA